MLTGLDLNIGNIIVITSYSIHYTKLYEDELEHLVKEFPFFQTARLLLLKNYHNQGSIKYDKELKRTAIWTTDRRKLFFLLDHRVLLPVDEEFIIKEPAKQITKSISDDADIIDFSVLTSITPSIYDIV